MIFHTSAPCLQRQVLAIRISLEIIFPSPVSSTVTDAVTEEESMESKLDEERIPVPFQQLRNITTQYLKPNMVHQQRQHAAEEAEKQRIEREGLVVLRVNMSDLFSKKGSVHARMETPMESLKRFEMWVSAAKTMPTHLLRDLKPMTLTVERVNRLPDTPLSHEDLSKRYVHAFVCLFVYPGNRLFEGSPGFH